MFTHPDPFGQLAAKHHRHMLAEARQRALGHQHDRRSSRMPDVAVKIARRLATAHMDGPYLVADGPYSVLRLPVAI